MPFVHEVPFQVHWEPFVLSDINLGSFLRWAGETNEAEVREVFSQVYLGLHEGPLPETLHVTTVAGNSLALELFGVLLKCCLFVALEASPKVKQHLAPSEQAGGPF